MDFYQDMGMLRVYSKGVIWNGHKSKGKLPAVRGMSIQHSNTR